MNVSFRQSLSSCFLDINTEVEEESSTSGNNLIGNENCILSIAAMVRG